AFAFHNPRSPLADMGRSIIFIVLHAEGCVWLKPDEMSVGCFDGPSDIAAETLGVAEARFLHPDREPVRSLPSQSGFGDQETRGEAKQKTHKRKDELFAYHLMSAKIVQDVTLQ